MATTKEDVVLIRIVKLQSRELLLRPSPRPTNHFLTHQPAGLHLGASGQRPIRIHGKYRSIFMIPTNTMNDVRIKSAIEHHRQLHIVRQANILQHGGSQLHLGAIAPLVTLTVFLGVITASRQRNARSRFREKYPHDKSVLPRVSAGGIPTSPAPQTIPPLPPLAPFIRL